MPNKTIIFWYAIIVILAGWIGASVAVLFIGFVSGAILDAFLYKSLYFWALVVWWYSAVAIGCVELISIARTKRALFEHPAWAIFITVTNFAIVATVQFAFPDIIPITVYLDQILEANGDPAEIFVLHSVSNLLGAVAAISIYLVVYRFKIKPHLASTFLDR